MSEAELIQKLHDLEWEDFEVKEAKAEVPKSSWETVSAFANSSGGWLVFGVKEIGKIFEIQGVTNPEKIEQDFLAVLRSGQKFNFTVDTKSTRYIIEGKTIISFYIPASSKKPVYFNTQSNTYIRRGSADQKATSEEIDAMYRDQTFGTKTSELIDNTTIEDLDENSIGQYRDYMSRFNPAVSYNRFSEAEFLSKLRVIDLDTGYCTFGGLLFFGKRESIEKHFPDFRIDLFEIPGTSYQDASSRYTFRLSEDNYQNLWECYFECFTRLKKFVDVEFKVSSEGFGEELSPGLTAMREALVNLLMHADYFSPARSRIRIFENHIEFYNPGGLPKPIKELKEKDISMPRNPIISKLFRMVRLAENAGFGFDKIESNWKAYNNSTPQYELTFDSTIVKLITKLAAIENTNSDNKLENSLVLKEQSKLIESQLTSFFEENLELLDSNFDFFAKSVQEYFGVTSERFRRDFGETSERLRRGFGDKSALLLFIISLNNTITAKEASEYLQVTPRTIETYFAKLKEKGVLERKGADFGGEWVIK